MSRRDWSVNEVKNQLNLLNIELNQYGRDPWEASANELKELVTQCLNTIERLEKQVAAEAGKQLTWRKQSPTEPGWYWRKAQCLYRPFVYEVSMGSDMQLYVDFFVPAQKLEGEWAGPIAEPVGEVQE